MLCPVCANWDRECCQKPVQHLTEWAPEFQDVKDRIRMFCPHCDFEVYIDKNEGY